MRSILCFLLFLVLGESYAIWRDIPVRSPEHYTFKRQYARETVYTGRKSHPSAMAERPHRALVLGCSYTYGLGVSNRDTFVWKLNELVPDCTFDNGGICGMGAYMALLTADEALSRKKYDRIIYAAIGNHLFREDCIHYRLLPDTPKAHIPAEQRDPQGWSETFPLTIGEEPRSIEYTWNMRYWPGDTWLGIINFARTLYYFASDNGQGWNNKEPYYQRYKYTIRALSECARLHGAKFGVVSLYNYTLNFKDLVRSNEECDFDIHDYVNVPLVEGERYETIPVLDASYYKDFMDGMHTEPSMYDSGEHPNAEVHSYYARKIAPWVRNNF